MTDHISREAALQHITKRLMETAQNNVGYRCDASDVFESAATRLHDTWINEIPAADVRPVVRGEWLLDTVYPSGVKKFRCSICGYDRTVHERYEGVFLFNFCSNCGADNREKVQDD